MEYWQSLSDEIQLLIISDDAHVRDLQPKSNNITSSTNDCYSAVFWLDVAVVDQDVMTCYYVIVLCTGALEGRGLKGYGY